MFCTEGAFPGKLPGTGLVLALFAVFPVAPVWAAAPTVTISSASGQGSTFSAVIQSSATGTGYLTLQAGSSASCGTGTQVKTGLTATGTNAFGWAVKSLSAGSPVTFTLQNLASATAYTACFTADDGTTLQATPVSVSATTASQASLSDKSWSIVGSAGISTGTMGRAVMALSAGGLAHLAYEDAGAIVVKRWTTSGWQDTGFNAPGSSYPALAAAWDGTMYLAYTASDGKTAVQKLSGSTWTSVGTALSSGNATDNAIAVTPSGIPAVAFADAGSGGAARALAYNPTTSTWVALGATASSGAASDISLASNQRGTFYLGLTDAASGGKAAVLTFDGTNWGYVGGGAASAGAASLTRMAIASNGNPVVAYVDATAANKASVRKYSGSWTTVGSLGASTGTPASLALGLFPNGQPVIAFADSSAGNVPTANYYTGSAWSALSTTLATGTGFNTAITMSLGGIPYVAFQDGSNSGKATVVTMTKPETGPTPGAPTSVSAVPGDGQIVVSFTPPTYTGTSAITGYRVTATPITGATASTMDGSGSPITISGLINGTGYQITVVAINASGAGTASTTVGPITPNTTAALLPGAPINISAAPGNAQVSVYFSAPLTSGSTVTGYTATVTPVGGGTAITASGTGSPVVVTGLTNGTAYTAHVSAQSSAGTGPISAESGSFTPSTTAATLPGAPSLLLATAKDGGAVIDFTAPISTGSSAITKYTVTCTPDGGGTPVTTTGLGSPITVTGLTNGVTYRATVVATNASGDGPISQTSAAFTPKATTTTDPTPTTPGNNSPLTTGTNTLTAGNTYTVPNNTLALNITAVLPTSPGATLVLAGQPMTATGNTGNDRLAFAYGINTGSSLVVPSLQHGSVNLKGAAANQSLLVMGTWPVIGETAGTEINAVIDSAGAITLTVISGKVLLPTTPLALAGWTNTTLQNGRLYPGEQVTWSSSGNIQRIRVASPGQAQGWLGDPVAQSSTGVLALLIQVPLLDRVSGRSGRNFLQQASNQITGAGITLQTGYNAMGALRLQDPTGQVYSAIPVGDVGINTSLSAGFSVTPEGRLQVADQGITVGFFPALLDYPEFANAVAAQGGNTVIQADGVLRARLGSDLLALRPDWFIQENCQTTGLQNQGRQWVFGSTAHRCQTLYPAFASFSQLQAAILGLDAQASLQTQNTGAVTLVTGGQTITLTPSANLLPVPAAAANQTVWKDALGVMYIRYPDLNLCQAFSYY